MAFVQQVLADPRAKDVQLPTGYSAVSEHLAGLVGSFLRLVAYNQAVFGSYYSDILSSAPVASSRPISSPTRQQ